MGAAIPRPGYARGGLTQIIYVTGHTPNMVYTTYIKSLGCELARRYHQRTMMAVDTPTLLAARAKYAITRVLLIWRGGRCVARPSGPVLGVAACSGCLAMAFSSATRFRLVRNSALWHVLQWEYKPVREY